MSNDFSEQINDFPEMGAIIGLDLGTKTIGLAISTPDQTMAAPMQVIKRKKFTVDAEKLLELMQSRDVKAMVIGLPMNMDGTAGPKVQSTKAFIGNFNRFCADRKVTPVPVAFWDERMSTIVMERELIQMDTSRAKRAEMIDEMAANYILQGALDRLKSIRNPIVYAD